MLQLQLSSKIKIYWPLLVSIVFIPVLALAGGEGGGGGSEGGVAISFGSYGMATLSNVGDIGGRLGGTISGNSNFGSAPGQYSTTAIYSYTLDGWISTQNPYDRGNGSGGSGNTWSATSYCYDDRLRDTPLCRPRPPIATISQNSKSVFVGASHRVTYGRGGGGSATSCTLQGRPPGGSFSNVQSNNGGTSNLTIIYTGDQVGSWQYRARCTGSGGTSSWVTINTTVSYPPPTLNLSANPTKVRYKETSVLSWSSTYVRPDTCVASSDPTGLWSGSKANSGSGETTPELTAATSAFTLRCIGLNESPIQRTAPVTVEYGQCADISSDDGPLVRRNSDVTLNFNVGTSDPAHCVIRAGAADISGPLSEYAGTNSGEGANSCDAESEFLGPAGGRGGSLTRTVIGETTFTIDCEGGNNTKSIHFRVLPDFQET